MFDQENTLLGKYAPALMKSGMVRIPQGPFSLHDTIHLPKNITNGDYNLQIEITHPNVQYMAIIPNAIKLNLTNFISPTGNPLMYNHNGLLLLM